MRLTRDPLPRLERVSHAVERAADLHRLWPAVVVRGRNRPRIRVLVRAVAEPVVNVEKPCGRKHVERRRRCAPFAGQKLATHETWAIRSEPRAVDPCRKGSAVA